MKHVHLIETVNVPGFRGTTLNLMAGCKGHSCKPHCWYFGRWVPRLKANPSITCKMCKTGEPHTHFERAFKITKKGLRRCYFQDMAEPSDFKDDDIAKLQEIYQQHPRHIFQLLTHFPASFYARYPVWSDNVWAMGTFTEGEIYFPASLRAGVVAAYCEPMTGPLTFSDKGRKPDWLVIGLMTGKRKRLPKLNDVLMLLFEANRLNIPIFLKPHPAWKLMKLDKAESEFPHFCMYTVRNTGIMTLLLSGRRRD